MGTVRGGGLQSEGEQAISLTQSINVIDPRQARMRIGACRQRCVQHLSQLGGEEGGRGLLEEQACTSFLSFGWTMSAANGGKKAWLSP